MDLPLWRRRGLGATTFSRKKRSVLWLSLYRWTAAYLGFVILYHLTTIQCGTVIACGSVLFSFGLRINLTRRWLCTRHGTLTVTQLVTLDERIINIWRRESQSPKHMGKVTCTVTKLIFGRDDPVHLRSFGIFGAILRGSSEGIDHRSTDTYDWSIAELEPVGLSSLFDLYKSRSTRRKH